MRYYIVSVLNNDGSPYQFAGQPLTWTTWVNGATDLGALLVEIDAPVSTLANPQGAASVTVWGVPLGLIGSAANLNGLTLQVTAGFKPGLPLATLAANAGQAGVILQGAIQQCYGNWIGVNQYIRFIVTTDGGTAGQQLNINTSGWTKGTNLQTAIKQTLQTAFQGASPAWTINVNVSASLVLPSDQPGAYKNLRSFAQWLKGYTAALLGGSYAGVDFTINGTTINVFDGTSPGSPKQLAFTDLIGQPTWIDPGTIQVTTAMRADISPLSYIQLPNSQVTIAPADPLVSVASKSVFQGSFLVYRVRHIGNSRGASALSWATVFDCAPAQAGS